MSDRQSGPSRSGDDPPLGLRTQPTERAADLPVEGTLPSWLRGRFYLNGPGRFEVGGRPYGHWFDPLALIRRFRIDGAATDGGDRAGSAAGTVAYRSRFLRSREYEWAVRRGRVRTAQPGTPPDRPLPVRLYQALAGEFTDNASIGVTRVAGDVLAVTESPVGHRLDPDSLATTDRVDLAAGLDADVTLGHVHFDAVGDGRRKFVGLGVSYGRDRGYVLFRRPAGTTVPTQVTRLPFDEVPYVHAFGLTDRYAVVPEYPFGVSARGLLRGVLTGGTFLDAFEARPGPTRFHVVDRATGDVVARPTADRTFAYHVANAYETGAGDEGEPTELVFDAVTYPDERAITGLRLANVRAGAPDVPGGNLVRFRIPLSGGRATREVCYEGAVEFPTINYRRYNGRPYRYVYLADAAGEGALPTRLVKLDLESNATTTWAPTAGWTAEPVRDDPTVDDPVAADGAGGDGGRDGARDPPHPSEATFVPRPADGTDGRDRAEDDGVLLTLVLDPAVDRSRLVVLDAADLSVLARAPLPEWTPYPFHGQFYAAADPVRTMQ
jgi:carotenoid cleavage dioxygenase-like enzyme